MIYTESCPLDCTYYHLPSASYFSMQMKEVYLDRILYCNDRLVILFFCFSDSLLLNRNSSSSSSSWIYFLCPITSIKGKF